MRGDFMNDKTDNELSVVDNSFVLDEFAQQYNAL